MATKDTIFYKREKGKLEVWGPAGKIWWIILLDRVNNVIRITLSIYIILTQLPAGLPHLISLLKKIFG